MDKVSYALGLGIGRQLSQMGAQTLNIDDFAQAIKDVLQGNDPSITDAEAQELVNNFFAEQEAKQREAAAERFKEVKATGEQFLADNAKKDGVVTLASGLQYTVLTEGSGRSPKATDTVKCNYRRHPDRRHRLRQQLPPRRARRVPPQRCHRRMDRGLQLMKEGAKYRFFIPYTLAYGERGAGQSIPPFSTLVFDVELIEVK